jgi:hypothetical protein
MVIDALYKKYFQKSKIFLYPLLGIKKGTKIVPTETYLSWNETIVTEDMKLVCVYKTVNSIEYTNFENHILLKHTRLIDYVKVNNENSIFTFDFSDLEDDWFHLINGRYSKISISVKRKILEFFDKNGGNYAYIKSYLFPEKHFEIYAKILNVPVELLIEVGELCDKPNLDKEKLKIQIADLENINESKLSL